MAVGETGGVIPVQWQSVGPGGGGGHMHPGISPADPDVMMFACDMGGIYLSTDGARSWRMLPGHKTRRLLAPAGLHPTDPDRIFLICFNGLWASFDRGATWQCAIGEDLNPRLPQYAGAGIFFDPSDPDEMVSVFSLFAGERATRLMRSGDGGRTWNHVETWESSGPAGRLFIDPASPAGARAIYVMGADSIMRTDDWGRTWTALREGLPPGQLTGFAAAWDKGGRSAFYASVAPEQRDGRYVGGVYKSTDQGRTWTESSDGLYRGLARRRDSLMTYRRLVMGSANLDLVYAICTGVADEPGLDRAVWRSTDGGRNWSCVSYGRPEWPQCNVDPDWMSLDLEGGWGWGGGPTDMVCAPSRPQRVFFTNGGNGYITDDAGGRWTGMFTDRVDGPYYRGRGAEVLTCYQVQIDPFDKARRWITYTDIGLFTSRDGGSTWALAAAGSPWPNTCYELALDPAAPGRAYGAWSQFHDLPHWKMLRRGVERSTGGVAVTDDYGMTWRPLGMEVEGDGRLPTDRGTCTTVVIDPDSPVDNRTIYAGFLNQGIYKSTDNGATWREANIGLPQPPRRNVWRLVRRGDGVLFCAITAGFPGGRHVPGGLFRSTDGAATWQAVGADQPFDWIFGLTLDPRDADTMYVSCFEVPPEGASAMGTQVPWLQGNGAGGVYKTTDGGRTWRRILDRPYCWDVSLHSNQPDTLFAGTFVDGVFRSTDAGETWAQLEMPPFVCTHRVTVEPDDDRVIWVTTFGGGVWKGHIRVPGR